tara:strand:- start:2528 stop:2887 length:360 start_codon:yes stop_codon:yes gene_type:complete
MAILSGKLTALANCRHGRPPLSASPHCCPQVRWDKAQAAAGSVAITPGIGKHIACAAQAKRTGRTYRLAVRAAIYDPLRGFPVCYVVRVADGQALRQAAVAADIAPDVDRLIVGIPAGC